MPHASITTVATEQELRGVPLREDRGTIVKITFEIVYPDKSKKIVAYDHEWINLLSAILFDEVIMNDKDKALFNVSKEDWRMNPAFIKKGKDGISSGSCCKNAGHGGADCWEIVK
jgi:hypothetical protein